MNSVRPLNSGYAHQSHGGLIVELLNAGEPIQEVKHQSTAGRVDSDLGDREAWAGDFNFILEVVRVPTTLARSASDATAAGGAIRTVHGVFAVFATATPNQILRRDVAVAPGAGDAFDQSYTMQATGTSFTHLASDAIDAVGAFPE